MMSANGHVPPLAPATPSFFQNAVPSLYGDTLVPDTDGNGVTDDAEMMAAAQALAGPAFMNTGIDRDGSPTSGVRRDHRALDRARSP